MKVVVLQSNYLPWKGYFDLIQAADTFIFYDEVQYTKNDWRNRNRIYTPNGLQWLTIPISKTAVSQTISEVPIDDLYWQRKHHAALSLGYRRAAHYHAIEPLLSLLYENQRWEKLIDVNRFAIKEICRILKISTPLLDSKDFVLQGARVERLLSLLQQAGATEYLTGPSARDYLAPVESLFKEAGITITYKQYDGYAPYHQFLPMFIHEVSILDLLAHVPEQTFDAYYRNHRS